MQVQLRNITMAFDNAKAVDNLSVTIEDGELAALLGPSGCGKSTTLFMLAGLYKPVSGDIVFGDKVVNAIEPERRNIGMVFQNYALYPHMTVLQNIMFPLKMQGVPKKVSGERAKQMAELVQIAHLLDRKPGQLSGGQQQRVAIARALVKQPRLLLLDEPLSNLDARLRLEMREEIRRIQKEVGITTVFVTHDQEEAMSISDRILLMEGGKLQQNSRPQDLYRSPANAFAARFIGSPPINMMAAHYDAGAGMLRFDDASGAVAMESGDVPRTLDAGIRPEDFVLAEAGQEGISGTVEYIETIGRDTLLRVRTGAASVRALVSPDHDIRQGDAVTLGVRPGRVHLFDRASGQRIVEAPATSASAAG
ncbi:ABC transporter ATP-binding protein [Paenibacillus sp. TRM 82003]|nr:ABC transporter ATP-binding protein [Paenibacillus sp. TRM 82003]